MRGLEVASPRLWRVAFAGAVVVNLALLYWPQGVSGGGFLPPQSDKVVHLLAFAAVALTGVGAGIAWRPLAAVLVVHAVTSEVAQARLLPARSGDPADVVADLAGILAGTLVATRWAQASWRGEHRT